MDLAELLDDLHRRGYVHNFAINSGRLRCDETDKSFSPDQCQFAGSQSVDFGTDPGDDATVYLIHTREGNRGYVILADSYHTDPDKAAFVNALLRQTGTGKSHFSEGP